MKAFAVLLIALVTIYSFTATSEGTFFKTSQTSKNMRETGIAQNKSGLDYYSIAQASKLMIRVNNGENSTVSVIIDSQLNLTWTNVGSSTIVKPPSTIENKLDVNLLNLTELVAKNYIQNNETNIIVSFSDSHTAFEKTSSLLIREFLYSKPYQIYTSTHAYDSMRFFASRLDYSSIFELAKNPEVSYIWLDRKFQANLDQSVRIIKDPADWTNIESSFDRSINGSGVKIAILDTGIDSTHPDFYFPNVTSKIAGAISFTGESTSDGFGHGTHCASIAAGTGAASSGQYVGVAPAATLLNVKVLDNHGEGYESWIISGIQWAVDNKANVLSMSFGTTDGGSGSDPLSTTVNWATNQGAVCTVAAGNSGMYGMYTIGAPGVADLAITVGASTKTDVIADFSSRGPTSDYRIKPDVVAPGVDIVAARANGTSMGTPVSQYYTNASGTSMATPHVAGAAALLLDAYPSWNPAEVKRSLTNYARDIGSNLFEQGSGRIDVCEAANASIIGNYSLTFGRVSLNKAYEQVVDFQNLATQTFSASLSVQAWHIGDQTPYSVASLNVSNIVVGHGDTRQVEITLNTTGTLPNGYFEGRITASFASETIHTPFFFFITPQLDVEVLDQGGSTVAAAFVLIDAQTLTTKAFLDERQHGRFVMPPGDYIIQATNIYLLNPSGSLDTKSSFILHKKFSAGADETINIQLSLASANKLELRTTDTAGNPISLILKLLLTPYYTMEYHSDVGASANQYLRITNLSEYMTAPCYIGYAGLSQEDLSWAQTNTLASEVDAYFIGWDLSKIGTPNFPNSLSFVNSELATFTIETTLPQPSSTSSIWFNQIAGMWQTLLWRGFQTHPGITWRAHVLPYQFKTNPSSTWADLEWSCIYVTSTRPDGSAEYYVIDRHFQPITKGENLSYTVGKTPLLPEDIIDNPPYYGSGLYVPYYPLRVEKNLFLAKTDTQATKRLEVFKNGNLISNQTMNWAQTPVPISQFLQSQGYGLYSFIVKTATSLNWSSQNTAEYIINYTSTSIDLIPPSITEIDCEPCFTKNVQQVEIQLADNDRVSNVSLFYSIDNDSYIPAELRNLGNNRFSTDLTFPADAQKISLIIEASDGNGNKIRFKTDPGATRGYETRIDAEVNGDRITGKLTVVGGSLLQPVYLKVKSNGKIMYTLTDIEGNFAFTVPQLMTFPLEIVMENIGIYERSSHLILLTYNLTTSTTTGGTTDPAPGTYTYIKGTVVSATAIPHVDYSFDYWLLDGAKQTANPLYVLMDSNRTLYAVFFSIFDLSKDGKVDMQDVEICALAFGATLEDEGWNSSYDFDKDGWITVLDLQLIVDNWDE